MARKRKAVKVKSTRSRSSRVLTWLAAARGPFLRWIAPPVALAALVVFGLSYARSYVSRSPRYQVDRPELVLPDGLPGFWRRTLIREIGRYARVDGRSVLDRSMLADLARQYERSPWVQEVAWVQTEFPNRVRAQIRVRYPAAALVYEVGGTEVYYLVGTDGVRLPRVYRGGLPETVDVPSIRGVQVSPPRPGRPWPSPAVTGAIEIIRQLRSSKIVRKALEVRAVDASNYGGEQATRSEFRVACNHNCDVDWGRAPGTRAVGELPVEKKVAKLERHILRGDPVRNRVLSVRFPGRIVVSRKLEWHGNNG